MHIESSYRDFVAQEKRINSEKEITHTFHGFSVGFLEKKELPKNIPEEMFLHPEERISPVDLYTGNILFIPSLAEIIAKSEEQTTLDHNTVLWAIEDLGYTANHIPVKPINDLIRGTSVSLYLKDGVSDKGVYVNSIPTEETHVSTDIPDIGIISDYYLCKMFGLETEVLKQEI